MTGTRDVDSGTLTAAGEETIHPVLLAKLEFDSGDVLAHSRLGDIVFNGDTYLGVGQFGGVGASEESSDLSRTTLTLSLSNIPGDMGAIALGEHYQGRTATLYLGYIDPETQALAGDSAILYRGRMDTMDIEQGESFTVSIGIESRFAAWDKPIVRRYNNADQQSRYSGDKGMEFAEQSAEKQVVWGGKLS